MATIAERTTEIVLPSGGRAFILPTNVKDIVTITGSLIGGPTAFKQSEEAAAEMAAEILDAGAGKLKKEAFREALAGRGAEVSFGAGGARLSFSAQCFPEDAKFVIERIADAIREPHLPAAEVAAEKTRALADLAEELGDTRSQAERALSRLIYSPSHPNYSISIKEEMKQVEGVTPDAIRRIAKSYGTKHAAIAVVGDIHASKIQEILEKNFGKTEAGITRPTPKPERSTSVKKEDVVLKDKASADIAMGAALGFNNDDPRYLPVSLVTYALGGSFAGHLMQTVRERDGLTYGIRSQLQGFSDKVDGYFRTWATFAPSVLIRGIDTVTKETNLFLKTPLTEEQLDKVKEEITGSYAVSLATTNGLARYLVRFAEDDRPLSWIDQYPDIIRAISLKDAQDAANLLASLPLSIATAGSTVL
jgi:zinc protease